MKALPVRWIRLEVPVPAYRVLEELHATGLYGTSLEETAEVLLLEALRGRIRKEDLELPLPSSPPPPPTAPRRRSR